MKAINIEEFLQKVPELPVFDVRTPAEFQNGHIPNAINLPLFTNEERAIVGTIYKQQGRQKAILKGLELVGPKMAEIITSVENATEKKQVLVHCWRGGMRSGSVSWLLSLYGFDVFVLKGGYKNFRRWAFIQFYHPKKIKILGGSTGSGKTLILHELQKQGEQIIDLEEIAQHKGSAFGALGFENVPTQEQFENNLAWEWSKLNENKIAWIEDESRSIGKKVIPENLWTQMREAEVFYLDIPIEKRVQNLVNEYGKFAAVELEASIEKVKKRLGGLATQQALQALQEGNLAEVARIMLLYYDKSYRHGLEKRTPESIYKISFEQEDPAVIALQLKSMSKKLHI